MEYKRFQNKIIARFDRGEEILTGLKEVCLKEKVCLASVSAIGATDYFTVGNFDVKYKKYRKCTYSGNYEIVSLSGNVTTQNGNYYAHLHMCACDQNGKAFGGHLNEAVISATCEMFIDVIQGTVERETDAETGLNILKFE